MPDNISSFIVSTKISMKQETNLPNLLCERNTTLLSTKQNCCTYFWSHSIGLRNLTHLQSTNISSTFYREGDTVRFTCTGDIGKPPGKFIWQATLLEQKQLITYSNETTNFEPIPDICSFRGTSNLTIKISADHFLAIIRCFEESQASLPEMYLETIPLDVHCKFYLQFSFQNAHDEVVDGFL